MVSSLRTSTLGVDAWLDAWLDAQFDAQFDAQLDVQFDAQFDAWLDVRSVCGPSIGRALLAVAALPLEQDLCHKADAAWLGGACLGPPDNRRLGRLGLGGDGHCHVL